MERQHLREGLAREVVDAQAPIFVDFDHTLFACNSTELFIASCKPSWLPACIDVVVRRLIPWRLTGITHWYRLRDYVCCALIVLLSPWNVLLWKRRAPKLFEQHESTEVADALRQCDPGRVVIISFGLAWIIKALLDGSAWSGRRLVATPSLTGPAYFSRGKLDIARTEYGDEVIAEAACISDSLDDQDLLHAVRSGILIEPQGTTYRAEEHLYLPMRYTAAAKYPRSYVLDQFLFVDVLILIVAVSFDGASLLTACLFVPPLMLSLMCIYELGYFENDMVAAVKEASPTLTPKVERYRTYPITVGAWSWAFILGLIGVWIGWHADVFRSAGLGVSLGLWLIVLAVVRAVFFAYNRLASRRRIFLYPVLQLIKYGSLFVLVGTSAPGSVLVLSQIGMMWTLYLVYRSGGNNKTINRDILRLMLFCLGLACLAASIGGGQAGTLFAYGATGVWAFARAFKVPIMAGCKALLSSDSGIRKRLLGARGRSS